MVWEEEGFYVRGGGLIDRASVSSRSRKACNGFRV